MLKFLRTLLAMASEVAVQSYSRDEFVTLLSQIIVSVLPQVDEDIDMLTRTVMQERLQLLARLHIVGSDSVGLFVAVSAASDRIDALRRVRNRIHQLDLDLGPSSFDEFLHIFHDELPNVHGRITGLLRLNAFA